MMATFDDASRNLDKAAKNMIKKLGSKKIQKLAFRDNWVFFGAKGELEGFEPKEEIVPNIKVKHIIYRSHKNEYEISHFFQV